MSDQQQSETSRQEAAGQAIALLDLQASRLTHAATNGSKTPEAGDLEYRKDSRRLGQLLGHLDVPNPIPYANLGEWNGRWKRPDLGKWFQRRDYVHTLTAGTVATLEGIQASTSLIIASGPDDATWRGLDARVVDLARELERALTNDDRQDVGRRAREILIAASVIIQDSDLVPEGEDEPKASDAKQWLDLYLTRYASGGSLSQLRKFVRSTWDLAQRVTHADIDRIETYAAAQSTVLIVRVLQDLELQASLDD